MQAGNPRGEPSPSRPWLSVAGMLCVAAALLAVVYRVLPPDVRPWNFTPVGALALFAGARLRPGAALALVAGVMGVSDLLLWALYGTPPFSLLVYVSFALSALLGASLLRRTESLLWIAGSALAGSVLFFLITNFGSWLGQAEPYERSLAGLLHAYQEGLPFYRSMLLGDLAFTAVLFGAHAWLTHAYFPAERVRSAVPEPGGSTT